MSSLVAIWSGEGTNQICIKAWESELKSKLSNSYEIRIIKSTADLNGIVPALMIIPGGRSHPIVKDLSNSANEIKSLRERGCSLLLSGAAAIAAADKTVQIVEGVKAKTTIRQGYTTACVEFLNYGKKDEGQKATFFNYWDPKFKADSNFKVVDRFILEGNINKFALATILEKGREGRGACLMTGVHYEISPTVFDSEEVRTVVNDTTKYREILSHLVLNDSIRGKRLATLLEKLGLQLSS